MPNKNLSLTYRWMEEVWNNGREDAIDELMDKEAVVHGIEGIDAPGPEGFKVFFHSFRQQFPQVHVDVEDVVSQDDLETSRCLVTVTDANGRTATFPGMTYLSVRNGRIAEAWNTFDFMSLYQQLGYKLAPGEEVIV